MQALRRLAEMTCFGHGDEVAKVPQLHGDFSLRRAVNGDRIRSRGSLAWPPDRERNRTRLCCRTHQACHSWSVNPCIQFAPILIWRIFKTFRI
ncbi:hypothetical protein GCM10027563_40680 [Parasphingorhabdus pacifica]